MTKQPVVTFLLDYNLTGQIVLLYGTFVASGWLALLPVRLVTLNNACPRSRQVGVRRLRARAGVAAHSCASCQTLRKCLTASLRRGVDISCEKIYLYWQEETR